VRRAQADDPRGVGQRLDDQTLQVHGRGMKRSAGRGERGAHGRIAGVLDRHYRAWPVDKAAGQEIEGLLCAGDDDHVLGLTGDGAGDRDVAGDGGPQSAIALVALRAAVARRRTLERAQLLGHDPAEGLVREQPAIDDRRTEFDVRGVGARIVIIAAPIAEGGRHLGPEPDRVERALRSGRIAGRGREGQRPPLGDKGARPLARHRIAVLYQPVVDLDGGVAGDAQGVRRLARGGEPDAGRHPPVGDGGPVLAVVAPARFARSGPRPLQFELEQPVHRRRLEPSGPGNRALSYLIIRAACRHNPRRTYARG